MECFLIVVTTEISFTSSRDPEYFQEYGTILHNEQMTMKVKME